MVLPATLKRQHKLKESVMIKTRKIDILDGIELKEATFKNKHFPTHFHDTYSIGIIKNGIENLKIKDNNLIAMPKTVVIINQYELHSNSFYNNDAWTYQTLNLNFDALTFLNKEQNHRIGNNFIFQNLIEDDLLYNIISNLHQTPNLNSYEQISAISEYLLLNYLVDKEEEKFNYISWENIIFEIKNLLESHLSEKINIESIAKKYNKTPFQLIRAFKSHTGLTPIAYLTLLRLNKSKKLLASRNGLVETALDCGFFDQSHFSNCFKKYFGVSPKQYCENYSIL
jgi:AraC-like DNA-binding protein